MHSRIHVVSVMMLLVIGFITLAACTASAREYMDAGSAREIAQSVCFRVEHLPPDFEIVARLMQDNPTAAMMASNPVEREKNFAEWGRLAGFHNHWAFEPPSMPGEDADGRMSDEEIEAELRAAEKELLAAPFRSATCGVAVYSGVDGAKRAYDAELEDLQNPEHLAHVTATEAALFDDIDGSVLVVHDYHAPRLTRFIVLVRQENVVAEISVSATCGDESSQDCARVRERAHSLAVLADQRLDAAMSGDDSSDPASVEHDQDANLPFDRARRVCGVRDYSGCVEAYLEHVEDGQATALCRNEHGSWRYEAPAGGIGDACSVDDFVIVDVLNKTQ